MPTITRVADRDARWQQSTFDPKAYKVELWEGRKIGQGRTLLSRYYPGQCVAPQRSSAAWDIFILEGDMTVNGERIGSGDHVLIGAGESCSWSTESGCLSLVFVRTDHEWVQSGNAGGDPSSENVERCEQDMASKSEKSL